MVCTLLLALLLVAHSGILVLAAGIHARGLAGSMSPTDHDLPPLGWYVYAPPVEVPEPRGLSVLWYSLLVVGMRILHHLAPGGPPQRVGYGWTLDYDIAS